MIGYTTGQDDVILAERDCPHGIARSVVQENSCFLFTNSFLVKFLWLIGLDIGLDRFCLHHDNICDKSFFLQKKQTVNFKRFHDKLRIFELIYRTQNGL